MNKEDTSSMSSASKQMRTEKACKTVRRELEGKKRSRQKTIFSLFGTFQTKGQLRHISSHRQCWDGERRKAMIDVFEISEDEKSGEEHPIGTFFCLENSRAIGVMRGRRR